MDVKVATVDWQMQDMSELSGTCYPCGCDSHNLPPLMPSPFLLVQIPLPQIVPLPNIQFHNCILQYELLGCMSQHLGRRRKVLHLWIFNSLQWRQITMPRRQRSTPHLEAGWPESKCERFVSSNLVNLSAIQHFHEILCWKQEQRHPCLIALQSLQNFQAPVWELMYHVFSQLHIPISSARAE